MLAQQPIEQCLIAVLKCDQVQIAAEIIGLTPIVLIDPRELLLDGEAGRRQQAIHTELDPFFEGEAGTLVEDRIIDDCSAFSAHGKVTLPAHRIGFRLVAVHALSP